MIPIQTKGESRRLFELIKLSDEKPAYDTLCAVSFNGVDIEQMAVFKETTQCMASGNGAGYFHDKFEDEYNHLVLSSVTHWLKPIQSSLKEDALLKDSDEFLIKIADKMGLHVDFSDKGYDGDKEAPMDRIGFLDYLLTNVSSLTPKSIRDSDGLYDTRIALSLLIRILSRYHNKGEIKLKKDEVKYLEGAKEILAKYFKVSDVLRRSDGNGTTIEDREGNEKSTFVAKFFGEDYHNMVVTCFNEDSEMSIIITSKRKKSVYAMDIGEANDLVKYISDHIKEQEKL